MTGRPIGLSTFQYNHHRRTPQISQVEYRFLIKQATTVYKNQKMRSIILGFDCNPLEDGLCSKDGITLARGQNALNVKRGPASC